MKKLFLLLFVLLIAGVTVSHAQLRKAKTDITDYRGPVFRQDDPSEGANLSNLFNMTMDHSYSMTFGSIGGNYRNVNMYTNTMRFYFTKKLTGRVDLSILHSPFGSGNIAGLNADKEVKFIIRNAELNYDISKNSSIHIQFQQLPYAYGYNRFGRGYGRFGRYYSPFSPLFH